MKDWDHQFAEFILYSGEKARGLFWSMRTGKTKAIIDLATYLTAKGEITGMIVVAPNGVHVNWTARELPKWWPPLSHGSLLTYKHLTWSSKNTKQHHAEDFLAGRMRSLHILSVNAEALIVERFQKLMRHFLKQHGKNILVVFDESHLFRRPGAKRTRLARGLAKKCKYRRILTGTAALNSPLHLWSQLELLQPEALGYRTFGQFKNQYAVYVNTYRGDGRMYPKLERYKNLEELRAKVSEWVSVVPRSEVKDLPPLIETIRIVPLTAAQESAYTKVVDHLESDLTEDLTITEAAVRITKLQQILSGFILDEEGKVIRIEEEPPRYTSLLEEVLGTEPCRVIVWCRFREELRHLGLFLQGKGVRVLPYHGGVPAGAREHCVDLFQNWEQEEPVVFLGQPQAAGMGLDLSNAEAVIWYSHTYDAITRDQASERATKMGTKSVAIVDLMTKGTVDEAIIANLRSKQGLANLVTGEGLLKFVRGEAAPISGKHGQTEEEEISNAD